MEFYKIKDIDRLKKIINSSVLSAKHLSSSTHRRIYDKIMRDLNSNRNKKGLLDELQDDAIIMSQHMYMEKHKIIEVKPPDTEINRAHYLMGFSTKSNVEILKEGKSGGLLIPYGVAKSRILQHLRTIPNYQNLRFNLMATSDRRRMIQKGVTFDELENMTSSESGIEKSYGNITMLHVFVA